MSYPVFRILNEAVEDYIPIIIAYLLVLLTFLFFQSNNKKNDLFNQQHIAKLEAHALRAQNESILRRLEALENR